MNRQIYIFSGILLSLIIFSCQQSSKDGIVHLNKWKTYSENDLLYNKAVINSRIEFNHEGMPLWLNKFNHNWLIEELQHAVYHNEIVAYNPLVSFPGEKLKISKEKINQRLGIEVNKISDFSEIKSIGFEEEWYFDSNDFIMDKKVVSWFPVRHYYREGDTTQPEVLLKKVFLIYNQDSVEFNKQNYSTLAKNIRTEFSYGYDPVNRYQGLNYSKYVSIILNKVMSGEIQAYHPDYNYDLTLVPIQPEKIQEEFGQIIELLQDEISVLVFDENWYINLKNMHIIKIINGVTLVREYYRQGDDLKTKRMMFYVRFNKPQV